MTGSALLMFAVIAIIVAAVTIIGVIEASNRRRAEMVAEVIDLIEALIVTDATKDPVWHGATMNRLAKLHQRYPDRIIEGFARVYTAVAAEYNVSQTVHQNVSAWQQAATRPEQALALNNFERAAQRRDALIALQNAFMQIVTTPAKAARSAS